MASGIRPQDITATVGTGLVLETSSTSTLRASSTFISSTITPTLSSTTSAQIASSASATASSSTSSDSTTPSGYISPAEAAGIGIGSAVAGALISIVFFWLLTRKVSSRSDRNSYHNDDTNLSTRGLVRPQSPEYRSTLDPAANGGMGMMEKATPMVSLKEYLPPIATTLVVDEEAVRRPWEALETRVRQHVASNYHQQYVQPSVFRSETLGALGYNRQSPALSQLVELLANVSTRASTLSYLLAVVISQRLDFAGNPKTTFLPPELIACMRAMNYQTVPKDKLVQWRTLTTSLTTSSYTASTISRNDPRSSSINNAINALQPLLRPLVHENCAAKAFEDLEDIFEDAAKFGLVIFGSNGLWGFDWERGEKAFKERKEAPGWPALKRLYTESEPRAPPPVQGKRRSMFKGFDGPGLRL